AQRRAPDRDVDGRAHGTDRPAVGHHPAGPGRAGARLPPAAGRRVRAGVLRRPAHALPRTDPRPEPAPGHVAGEAGRVAAGVRPEPGRRGDDDRRELLPADRRRRPGAARLGGVGEGAPPAGAGVVRGRGDRRGGLRQRRGRAADGARVRRPPAAGPPWADPPGLRLLRDPRGVRRAGARHPRRLGVQGALGRPAGPRRAAGSRRPVEAQRHRVLAGGRAPVLRHRRADRRHAGEAARREGLRPRPDLHLRRGRPGRHRHPRTLTAPAPRRAPGPAWRVSAEGRRRPARRVTVPPPAPRPPPPVGGGQDEGMDKAQVPDVLAQRYASPELVALWSPEEKVRAERRLWLAVLRAQRDLGVPVPDGVVEAYEAVLDRVDLASIAARERVTRHDVKARIEEFCALAGHEHLHKGMTSRDLTENVEQMQIRSSLLLMRDRTVAALARLARLAVTHAGTVMVGRTHNVPAQATTLGKRFATAAQELLLAHQRLEELIDRYPLRGIKGPVGTAADQLDLLGGDRAALAELERRVAAHLGFTRVLDSVGQVYPRSLDLDVVSALV